MVDLSNLYDGSKDYKQLNIDHYKTNVELSYKVIENGYLMPFFEYSQWSGGVCDSNKQWVDSTSWFAGVGDTDISADKIKETACMDETVIFMGIIFNGWGHVLTDCIRRCWFLGSEQYHRVFEGCKLVYLPHVTGENGEQLLDNIVKFFSIIGINIDTLIPITKVTKCSKIIIPDECFFREKNGIRCFTKEYREIIDRVRDYQKKNFVEDAQYNKVYYTHAAYRDDNQIGEEKLERFFANQGYKIIAPEEYSLDEQLNILANCHNFASTVGSCAHNMIFLPEHSNIYLINRYYCYNVYQSALNDLYEQNIFCIDSSLSVLYKTWTDPFYYFISKNMFRAFNLPVPKDKKFWQENLADLDEYLSRVTNWYDLREFTPPLYYMKAFWEYAGITQSLRYLPVMFGWKVYNKLGKIIKSIIPPGVAIAFLREGKSR